jgi:hypothetical protein
MKSNTILKLFTLVMVPGKTAAIPYVVEGFENVTRGMGVIIPDPKTGKLVHGAVLTVNQVLDSISVHIGTDTFTTSLHKARKVILKYTSLVNSMVDTTVKGDAVKAYEDFSPVFLDKIVADGGNVWLEMQAAIGRTSGRVEHFTAKVLVPKTVHDRHILHLYKDEMQLA